ncbi:glycosyltransferase [Halosimplex halophilum]|uniref:glycosyltransferase n=1 Tax=Halosimplex halophilum TaxID=2559572 RepID=UPI001FEA91D6|nr:glycosyltransferase [Halosimplex halophilum]
MFRAAKFTKYLSRLGAEVHVLTVERQYQPGPDNEEYAAVLETAEEIHRTGIILDWLSLGEKDGFRWTPKLTPAITRIVHKNNIDAIFHTAWPFLPLLNVPLVKSFVEVPYIVDFRDPWTLSQYYEQRQSSKSLLDRGWAALSRHCEPRILRAADAVTVSSSNLRCAYESSFPEIQTEFKTLTNGFDPEDYHGNVVEADGFRIIYPGKFRNDVEPFFEGFAKFAANKPDVKLIHYGKADSHRERVKDLTSQLGISDKVEFNGYAAKHQIIRELNAANIGLVLTRPEDRTHIPIKVFDYFACDLPVLAIDSEDGAISSLLEDFPGARLCHRSDVSDITHTLESLYNMRPESLGDDAKRSEYSVKALATELLSLLEQTTQ